MALDNRGEGRGVWKSGRGKGRPVPKGRQLDDDALAEVQAILGDGPRRADLLIEYLHLIQDRHGHLSARHLRALAWELQLAQAEVWEVATFYAHFDPIREDEPPPPDLTIRVCDSLSCELAGAHALKAALKAGHDPARVRVLRAPCMGRCDTAPVAEVGHRHVGHATPETVAEAIAGGNFHPVIPDYERFDTYRAGGGYDRLMDLRESGDWEAVQEKVLASGLRGLGGAGFPSGKKWGFVRAGVSPRYLAVNGDEGEPGTFKDRWFLERRPHLMLEGMLIAAWAIASGLMQIVGAIRLRKEIDDEWLLIASGVLSVLFGIAMLAWPGAGALAMIFVIGTFAILYGALLISFALRLRKLAHATA